MNYSFCYISLPSLHDWDVKFPDGTFRGGRKHTVEDEFFFLFLNLGAVSKNSTPGNFTYIRCLKRVRIIATTFEKKRIHFNSDLFLSSPSSLLKLPKVIHSEGERSRNSGVIF